MGEVKIPNNQKMKGCYDLVLKETPDLYRSLREKLLSVANGSGPADARFQSLPATAGKIWSDFLSKDAAHKSKVVKSSWVCCVGDLAEALLKIAIQEIIASDDSFEKKGRRLDKLMDIVKNELYDPPTSPGMVLEILMAKNSLTSN